MKISEAISLINPVSKYINQPMVWADLGCGDGLFSKALSGILPDDSVIYAFDISNQKIEAPINPKINIEFINADIVEEDFVKYQLEGILMANSLHYINDQYPFLEKIYDQLKEEGYLIILEYDQDIANSWVPFPIRFQKLSITLSDIGFKNITKIGKRRSIYGGGNIYACLAMKTKDSAEIISA